MATKTDDGASIRWFRELDAADVGDYSILIYETWLGSNREDPATQIEEYMSVFKPEDMPEEYSTSKDQSNIAPYIAKKARYSYRDEYEGLEKEQFHKKLRVIKQTDRDALKHQRESASLLPDPEEDPTSFNSRYRHSAGGVYYEDFLAAIDRVSENDKDEEAWEIINKWRSRSLRSEERSI
jgi:hypothetical protein